MAAPRSVELYEPNVLRLQHLLVEVRGVQNDHVFVGSRTTALLLAFGLLAFAATFPLANLGANFVEGVVDDGVCVSSALVVDGLVLVEPEELDGWEALDAVGLPYCLVSGHVHCAHLNHPL